MVPRKQTHVQLSELLNTSDISNRRDEHKTRRSFMVHHPLLNDWTVGLRLTNIYEWMNKWVNVKVFEGLKGIMQTHFHLKFFAG